MKEFVCCDWRKDISRKDGYHLAITAGDINGVGLEIIGKALGSGKFESVKFTIFGPGRALRETLGDSSAEIFDCGFGNLEIRYGENTAEAGEAAYCALKRAVEETLGGKYDALVTAPLSKYSLRLAGYDYPGHTEILKELCAADDVLMMFLSENMIIGLLTVHIALKRVPEVLTRDLVLSKVKILDWELRDRFGIDEPKIALCALNPHGGESGLFGDEEVNILRPAAAEARKMEIDITDPLPADTLFPRMENYSAAIAVYHDQGLIPAKLAHGGSVNFSGGLPLIRTSPDHGCAFDIAGKGIADPGGMINAIEWALRLCR